MHRSVVFGCLLVVLASFLVGVEGKVNKGKLKGNDWIYVDKFAYGYDVGQTTGAFAYNVSYTSNIPDLQWCFYDDQGGNWSKVFHGGLSCEEKVAMSMSYSGKWVPNKASGVVPVTDTRSPHFFYFALASCGNAIDVDYYVSMTQADHGHWAYQFSYDEQGLGQMYLFYMILFIIGAVVHGYTIWWFSQNDSYHTIVKLFTFCIALEGFSVFCMFIHYAVYAGNGQGAPGFKGVGELLDMAAQITFMLLVILVAKGWCISSTQIEGRIPILVGLGVVIVTYLAMFIWEHVGLNPASVLYVYQTAPGIIIIVVRCLVMFYFLFCIRNTYMEENKDNKRQFYLYFGIVMFIWFLSLPIVTAIAESLTNHEVLRLKVVMILYVTFNAIFLIVLGFLLWPSRAYDYFQISARNIDTMPYESI
jgi:hypothetical protein